jgi:ABC-type nitrate/sulfonate/bicarbonate transport system permease component
MKRIAFASDLPPEPGLAPKGVEPLSGLSPRSRSEPGGELSPTPAPTPVKHDPAVTTNKVPGRWRERAVSVAWFALAWLLMIGAWELGVAQGFLNPRILPPPSETLPYALNGSTSIGFGMQQTTLLESTLITLARIVGGLCIGLVMSLASAVLIIEIKPLRRLLLPIVQTLAPVSPVAWIPFAIAVVGIGAPAAIFVVFMAIYGSVTLSTVAAFDSVPREYIKVAQTLGTSRFRIWRRVLLPAAAPGIMTMLRMSLFGAWMAVLAGEMAGINSGLGYLIIMGQQMFNMKLVMVGILIIGVVGFAMDRLALWAQHRLIWWERT